MNLENLDAGAYCLSVSYFHLKKDKKMKDGTTIPSSVLLRKITNPDSNNFFYLETIEDATKQEKTPTKKTKEPNN